MEDLLPELDSDVVDEEEEGGYMNMWYLALCVLSAYIVYYIFFVVQKPSVSCNPRLQRFLYDHCPLLQEKYWPTIWCVDARVQTIIRSLVQSKPRVPYVRELISLPDGGEIGLDWIYNEGSRFPEETRPTVIILPGLTGCSKDGYILHLAQESIKLGFRCCVFNYRGNGGAQLKTSQTYNATNTADLEHVIVLVTTRYPSAVIFGTGISLGGVLLTNYLARTGKDARLVAGIAMCAPWNIFGSAKSLEEPFNAAVFNKYLCDHLKQALQSYEHLFKDMCDLQHVYKSRTIRDFDERFTAKVWGYKTNDEYYHEACIDRKVHEVKVPLLCLNAADDPFSPRQFIPVDEAARSSHVAIVMTPRGGHIAFLDGFFLPNEISYMQRMFAQFTNAVLNHREQLLSSASSPESCSSSQMSCGSVQMSCGSAVTRVSSEQPTAGEPAKI